MKLPISAIPKLICVCLALVMPFGIQGFAQDDPEAKSDKDGKLPRSTGDGDRKGPPRGDAGRSEGRMEGSREDHEKLRKILGEVWDDPAVIQSREEVRIASDNFRKVLHAKIAKLDPEAAELMEKMKGHSRSGRSGGDFGGSSRGMRPEGSRTGLDYMAKPPFYASLDEAEKGIYDEAYQAAIASEKLQSVVAEMSETRKQDDELRKKRTTQFVRARKLLYEEMVKADPQVREYFARSGDGPGSRGGPKAKDGQEKPRPPKER